ncbi:RNA polymerase sigma-I factor [Wukongibacter sp. M2B1]|uniref:RNA polymerase sigma-I factor n=1 Tax=Wukongibacter sp. M2B1 TaxID=3088895 RepID=UPI003D7AA75A
MGPFLKIFKRKKINIEDRLKKIKNGDEDERENLIKEYTPFIIKSITKVTNRYIEIENNEEFSIGLEAFNEAINKYEFEKGNFIKYSEIVIRNRIIDFHRKTKRLNNVVSIDRDMPVEANVGNILRENDFTDKYDMKDQICRLYMLLKGFNITFNDLVNESPKHMDTRLNSINIAKGIVENEDIKEDLFRKKVLPAKKIMERIGVSKKVLKGNRKFIIATVLILDSDLDLLIDYICQVEGGIKHGV